MSHYLPFIASVGFGVALAVLFVVMIVEVVARLNGLRVDWRRWERGRRGSGGGTR